MTDTNTPGPEGASALPSKPRRRGRWWKILLIIVVILSALGTLILQRPVTEPDEVQRAYSPQALRIFDAIGLTDVFHAWWFVALLLLVSLSIVAASIERFPNAWRHYSRPYKYPDNNFRRFLPAQKEFAIADEETGLVAAERALHHAGYKPERVVHESHFSLFAERNRISEMAVYIVHASLLLIFLGGIMDALWGWRGTLNLTEGQTSNLVEMRDASQKPLPFSIRCDRAGQENYPDGTPKKWWSDLAVVKDGNEVVRKEIVVNDPLLYSGVRFYQSSFGQNGKVAARLRRFHDAERVLLSWDGEIVCFVTRNLEKHAAVGSAFVGLSRGMQESRPESEAGGHLFAVANRVAQRLQQRFVLGFHLHVSQNREVVACAQTRKMGTQNVLQRTVGADDFEKRSSVLLVGEGVEGAETAGAQGAGSATGGAGR